MVHHAPNEIVPNLFSAVMLKEDAECEKFMPAFNRWKKI